MNYLSIISPDEEYFEVRECDYKGEHYSVRDNGAIMRHPKNDKKRPSDNKWTFGKKDASTGYMMAMGVRVHIVVATAFYGPNNSSVMVVDHIDTNRCNNRPENLRWLTRLENILLNVTTRKKIEYICGSVENFLNNPSLLNGHEFEDRNFEWMRTVTKEEAANTLLNWKNLFERPKHTLSYGHSIDERIFRSVQDLKRDDIHPINIESTQTNIKTTNNSSNKLQQSLTEWEELEKYGRFLTDEERQEIQKEKEQFRLQQEETLKKIKEQAELPQPTSNPLAFQFGWNPFSNIEFPYCPKSVSDNPIQEYFNKLKKGEVFCVSKYGESVTHEFTIYKEQILVVNHIPNGVKEWGLTKISWDGKCFIHEGIGTYFEENGALAEYTMAQDKKWEGEEPIDWYC